MFRLCRRRQMQRDEVRPLCKVFKPDQFNSSLVCSLRRDKRVVRNYIHVERLGSLSDFSSNTTEPYYSKCLVAKFGPSKRFFVPNSCVHLSVGLWDGTCRREHQCKGMFCDAYAVCPGGVNYENSFFAGRSQINVVNTSSCASNDAEMTCRIDDFLGYQEILSKE